MLLTACGSSNDICNCTPNAPESDDYRHSAKHVPLPNQTPTEIDVNTILSWSVPTPPPADAPRSGRELTVYHIALAYAQATQIRPNDCDIHVEISQTPDKNAPRVIVETPVDSEYCSARRLWQQQLASHGFTLSTSSGELPQALPVEVLGLAFEDFEHNRGSAQVATPWELHPATVQVTGR